MTRRLLLLACLGLALVRPAAAAAPRPNLEASQMETDPGTGELVLTGNAHLTWENLLLKADEIRYNARTGVATARGHVELTRGPQRLLADQITYKVEDRSFDVQNIRFGQYPFYASGLHGYGTRDRVIIDQAIVSYTEPYPLAPALKAKRLTYVPNQTVRADDARIGLGGAVPISLPRFQQSVQEPLLSYLDATFGYRESLGAHLGVGALLPVQPGLRAGGNVAFYTERGLLAGPGAVYDTNLGGQEIFGRFQSAYIHDYGERLHDILGRPIQGDRGYIDWTHRQQITDRLSVFGQLHYWSDSEVVRDFNPAEFYRIQTPDTFVEGLYTGRNYTISLFSRFQPNRYVQIQQRLPELRFDLLPTPIGFGFYERFQASAAALSEHGVAGAPNWRSNRLDAYYGLSRPIAPNDWLTFTPVAGARITHYARATGGKDDYTRTLGELGFDLQTRMSGVFEYKNPRWDIDGIRHLLTPRLSYRYIPDATKGQAYIPPIDRQVFSTYLQPLGLGDVRNIDNLSRTNTLRIGVDNLFQTRNNTYGSRDLLMANIAADLRFSTEEDQDQLSYVHTELAFMPATWLQFDLYQSVDPEDLTIHELNTGIRIMDSDIWSVRFSNHYLEGSYQEYIIDARYKMTEAYELVTRLHYDARETRFVERTVGVRQNIHNLWSIEYAVSFFSGRTRESNFGFALRVDLLQF